jgi:hypothetical protein
MRPASKAFRREHKKQSSSTAETRACLNVAQEKVMKSLLTIPASFLALLFFAHNLQAQTPLPTPRPLARSDRQFWNETQFRVDLSKRWTLNFLQFTRAGDEARSDTRTGLGLLFKVNRHYAIQPTYVYQYAHPGEGRKVFGSLGIAVGCPNILWSMNQYHSKEHPHDYSNRATVEHPRNPRTERQV